MPRTARTTLIVPLLALTMSGCRDVAAPINAPSRSTRTSAAQSSFMPRGVRPKDTDPAIDLWPAEHLVWVDSTVRSNHQLLLFFGGANSAPSDVQLVAKAAAGQGYRVIVLMYPNTVPVGQCFVKKDPNPLECQKNLRLEMLDGTDRTIQIKVDSANSIYNRFTKLLSYLANADDQGTSESNAGDGWSEYLLDDVTPRWSRIAVGGFSLGGGQAALIAQLHHVKRVVLLAAPLDGTDGKPSPWVGIDATPANRYFTLVHYRDPMKAAAFANWLALGLVGSLFTGIVREDSATAPSDWTHTLTTDRDPRSPAEGCNFPGGGIHRSVAEDRCTPMNGAVPALQNAWIHLLTAPYGQGHGRPASDDAGHERTS